MYGNKIIEKVEVEKFLALIAKYPQHQIECTGHAFFRLNEEQRQIYTEKEICRVIMQEKPFLVGLQSNSNHAVFYKYQGKILKILVAIETRKVNIVTFYFINGWQVPKL